MAQVIGNTAKVFAGNGATQDLAARIDAEFGGALNRRKNSVRPDNGGAAEFVPVGKAEIEPAGRLAAFVGHHESGVGS